jgi:N-acetylglucosamine malate deacetylase 1
MRKLKKICSYPGFIFGSKMREIYSSLIYNWILHIQSKPLSENTKTAIVFAPHQDDETFGCGGIIALKRARKIPVKVVFMTDGTGRRPEWIKAEEMIDIRQEEAIKALNFLGLEPSAIKFLSHKDGSLTRLSSQKREEIVSELAVLIKEFNPGEIYLPHHNDRHVEHEATYELVEEAIFISGIVVELLQYPVWMFWQNPLYSNLKFQEISSSYRIPICSVQYQKKQAIASYDSQVKTLPPGFLNRFFSSYEIFIKN